MKLSEVKSKLSGLQEVRFRLPNGTFVPDHFHVTEVGETSKDFIDCGGIVRREKKISFQLWDAGDFDHRLAPQKLVSIISLAEKVIHLGDWEVEVEYQGETIGRYGISFSGDYFILNSLITNCLAKDNCGIPASKPGIKLTDLQTNSSCMPGGGCC